MVRACGPERQRSVAVRRCLLRTRDDTLRDSVRRIEGRDCANSHVVLTKFVDLGMSEIGQGRR